MNPLKKNIAANFAGSIWQAIMGLVFIPLYIKFMGVESYGLIGIFASLQAIFVFLDMGLSATLTRELARLSALPGRQQEIRNLVRSMEIVYWCVAIFIGMVIVAVSPFIAHHWVKSEQLSPKTIEHALLIMGLAIALQWPASFYSGGIEGLQRQMLLNAVNIGISTLRGVGAVLILWLVSPTIQAFFSWQIIVGFINTGILAIFLWHRLPLAGKRATFQSQLLVGIWRFAAGLSGITILSIILAQLDKIILSRMLSLEMFGYYTLAWVVTISLYRVIAPVYSALYPRFIQLVFINDQAELKLLYHKSCQFMSVLIFPVTVVVAMFSYEIILIWTQNSLTADKSHILVSILISGMALSGLMNIPLGLQLAHGWTRLRFYSNLISVILLVPLIIFLTTHYGALGGASAWLLINGVCVFISIYFMHRRLLPNEEWRWYWQDVGLPLLASLMTAGLGRILIGGEMSQSMMLLFLCIVSCLTFAVTAITTPTTRIWLFNRLLSFNRAYRY